jgi:hypothetical protein
MEQQIEFIRNPLGESRAAAPAAPGFESLSMGTDSAEQQPAGKDESLAFDLHSVLVRKRAVNMKRKGLIDKHDIDNIMKQDNEISKSEVDNLLLELVVERNNFLPVCFLEVGAQQSRAICKIAARGTDHQGKSGSWFGTGILVGENILLTNHHVLNSIETAQNATCIFNYQVDGRRILQQTREFTLDPTRLFITSPVQVKGENGEIKKGLDYTFVWINGEPAKDNGFVPLNRSSFNIAEGENANIIQHPSGNPKIVALQDNIVTWQDLVVVHYTTDTEPGSSGAIVLNNEWKPIALHHASSFNTNPTGGNKSKYVNEGIKLSAIAAHLEQRSREPEYAKSATEVLKLFSDVDTTMGFFGGLGRSVSPQKMGVEKVVDSYQGEDDDVDVGFWNIEWFNKYFVDKLERVAEVVVNMNLDIWGFSESSLEATQELVRMLKQKYNLDYDCMGSEPDAPSSKQANTVLWNTKTLDVQRIEWPDDVKDWFLADSTEFNELGLGLESVEGPIFPRVAQPFLVTTRQRQGEKEPFAFNFLPLHLKAMDDGSQRRRMASRIIGAAIERMKQLGGYDNDWIIGGDLNAPLASQDFKTLLPDMLPLSATDEKEGAFSYLKKPKSLIDHIFLSKEMAKTFGRGNYFVVAAEKAIPNYIKDVSDHRPVLLRLSLHNQSREEKKVNESNLESLVKTLAAKFPPKPEIGELKPKEMLQ